MHVFYVKWPIIFCPLLFEFVCLTQFISFPTNTPRGFHVDSMVVSTSFQREIHVVCLQGQFYFSASNFHSEISTALSVVKGRFTFLFSAVSEVNCKLALFCSAHYSFWRLDLHSFVPLSFLPQSIPVFRVTKQNLLL